MQKFLVLAALALFLSAALSYVSYFVEPTGVNTYQALSSFLFWGALLALAFRFPLRGAATSFARYIRSILGLAVFATYLSIHLVVYGFILEGIIASVYPEYYGFPVQTSVLLSASPLYPFSTVNLLASYFVSPNIDLTIPPALGASLSMYSIAMALMIGILVGANIMGTLDLKSVCTLRRKSLAFVALPAIGVVGGASCCLSLPIFITFLAAPSAALASASSSLVAAYYVTYFLVPPATVVALKLNFDSITKLSRKIAVAKPSLK